MVKPKKHLGQHFLTQPAIAQKIVHLLPSSPHHTLLEVGPGKGILTQYLLPRPNPILAIEVDREAVEYLRAHFAAPHLTILHQDLLTFPLPNQPIFLIGNLPYNLSSPIFFYILEHYQQIDFAVVMVQKEVAERITASPCSKNYGILSVLLGIYYHSKMEFTVKPGNFFPPPKVDSAVITLKKKPEIPSFPKDKLFNIVKTAFQQRRKILSNSLKAIIPSLPPSYGKLRPEQLSVEDFLNLSFLA